MVQVGEIDRDVSNVHAATGGEATDIEPGSSKERLLVRNLSAPVSIERNRSGPELRCRLDALPA